MKTIIDSINNSGAIAIHHCMRRVFNNCIINSTNDLTYFQVRTSVYHSVLNSIGTSVYNSIKDSIKNINEKYN